MQSRYQEISAALSKYQMAAGIYNIFNHFNHICNSIFSVSTIIPASISRKDLPQWNKNKASTTCQGGSICLAWIGFFFVAVRSDGWEIFSAEKFVKNEKNDEKDEKNELRNIIIERNRRTEREQGSS